MPHLRKISSIKKAGHYKDKTFISQLIEKNKAYGWGLKIEKGAIVITKEKFTLIMHLLNNDRVESQINSEVFDATVKKKV
jgi:hypothetical protein